LIVATTHPRVLDSELQKGDGNSPVWHNHYVNLGAPSASCAGAAAEVTDISYESPGKMHKSPEFDKLQIRSFSHLETLPKPQFYTTAAE